MKRILECLCVSGLTLSLGLVSACGGSGSDDTNAGVGSEVAVSTVSGALNNSTGTALGWLPVKERKSTWARLVDEMSLVRDAWAASWTCTGGNLSPAYAGPADNPYTFTPVSCTVGWKNGKSASSKWSGSFILNYGASCDSTHARIENQVADCSRTRTTAAGGNTRTITGPEGNAYSVTHDTNGLGTGWDSSVSPAPSNAGVVAACGDSGCSSGTLTVNGSHLTGTLTPSGGSSETLWDHTVSTGAGGIAVSLSGGNRVVSGTVIVQHNLAKFTSTTTFNDVTYGDDHCCFPTSGSVTTTFSGGPDIGKHETVTFSDVAGCGEVILTTPEGSKVARTFIHCI